MSKRSKILVVLGVVITVVVVGSLVSFLVTDKSKGSVDVSIVEEADVTSVESSQDINSSENSDEEKDDKGDKPQDEDEVDEDTEDEIAEDIEDVKEDGIYGSRYNDDTYEKQSSGEYKDSERTGGISKEDRDNLNSMTEEEIKASDKAFHSVQSGSPD